MKFKKLKLFTDKLDEELDFYSNRLGFELLDISDTSFTIKVGWSELTFIQSDNPFHYHYCFLIPSNQLKPALKWMEDHVDIISIDGHRKTQRFESWNADSFYFSDASGNVAEFIVRYDLNNETKDDFDISQVLAVNEMGLPTDNVAQLNALLEEKLQTKFWKGDLDRFGTNGSQEGIWLMPNFNQKETWFPSEVKIEPQDFSAVVENHGETYEIDFKNERLTILKTTT